MATEGIRHPVVSSMYDGFMRVQDILLGIGEQRRRTVERAHGRVLEVGFGTGLNLRHYPDDLAELVAVEPDPHMRERAASRLRAVDPAFTVELVPATAERLPFADDSFDTVVICFVLCTVSRQRPALAEVRRVLTPDGRLLLLEHVRSHQPAITWLQLALTPVWRQLAAGCHLDRQTSEVVEASGFTFERLWRSGSGRGSIIQGQASRAPL